MGFQCGIVGLPNVGKSTLFNALTRAGIPAANYPFCTIEPNQALVPVPDPRLARLTELVQPQAVVPTTVTFVDIAGLVAGAAKGEGLGNQFLGHIREACALVHVVRCFEHEDIVHVSGRVDPLADIEIIDTELALADLAAAEKALCRLQRAAKGGDKTAQLDVALLMQVLKALDQGEPLRRVDWDADIRVRLGAWQFLTLKPVLYLANVDEQGLTHNPWLEALSRHAEGEGATVIPACVQLEADLVDLSEAEQQEWLRSVGAQDTSLAQLVRAGYALLDLQTFFTAGEKEVRAWTVSQGATAPEAAGCIHTDFQKGFIRAEVIGYEDFIACGGEQGAKAAGKWRLEGKTYRLQDGDVVHFRFNT